MSDKRVQAIDFFRGLVLLFIVVDHMPDNPAGQVTLRHWSLADAAEAFVFISGFTAALVQQRLIAREGRLAAARRLVWRSGKIYLAFLATALVLCLAIAGAGALELAQRAVWTGFGDALLADPVAFLIGLATMATQPGLVNVLPLYVVLMVVAPAVVWGLQRAPLPTLAASLAVWWLAPQLNLLLPSARAEGYLFNPFAWQGLFVIGALFSVHGAALLDRLDRLAWGVTPAALVIAVGSAALAPVWETPVVAPDSPLAGLVDAVYPIDKWNLHPVRVLSILTLAWLVRRLLRRIAVPWNRPVLSWLTLIGRQGLPCFALGTLISFAGDLMARNLAVPAADYLAAVMAAALLLAVAAVSEARDRRKIGRPAAAVPLPAENSGTLSPIRH